MIKVALTNLGKYNEGELDFVWLRLPATDEEIANAFEAIEVADDTQYEEYFISDYEAPIGINIDQHTDLEAVNEMAEKLEGIDELEEILSGTFDPKTVLTFARQAEQAGLIEDANYHVGDIISDERMGEMVRSIAEESGWHSVANFLASVKRTNDEYYLLDGYENAENLEYSDLESIVEDIVREITRHI